MEIKRLYKLGQRGQSTVEYILLMVVVVSIAFAVMNSPEFKKIVGEDAELMEKMRKQMQYSYRHARSGLDDSSNYDKEHDTYFNRDEGKSRFFFPSDKYPQ